MSFSDDDIRSIERFLKSPLAETLMAQLRYRYILAFRGSRDMDERIMLAAKLDAADELLRAMEGVLEDIELENVQSGPD